MEKEPISKAAEQKAVHDVAISSDGWTMNASGHRDQLQRQYGLWSICGMALTIDNAWVALGASLSIAICELAT